jgi:hypothetical protein
MRLALCCLAVLLTGTSVLRAELWESKPSDAAFEKFQPWRAPRPARLVLKPGDRLALCGDSITEQRMYSRIIETYLAVCAPELNVSVRQYGWSGERADGFLRRMTNDCLRFKPTLATTCYGMNDHKYRAYEDDIGRAYRSNSTAILRAFRAHGARVIQGSPGCVGKRPTWTGSTNTSVEDLNLSLCALRNIGLAVAIDEQAGFADVFWPMFTAGFEGKKKYGPDYAIAGKDGVHPGWAGSTLMAYAFLKSFGLDGEIGTFTVDLKSGKAKVSKGHKVLSARPGELRLESRRYPFCATNDAVNDDNTIRSAMTLVPFNAELNRLTLVGKNGRPGARYKVTWGETSHAYTAEQLAAGVNLADDFALNPFWPAFRRVDEAVAAKQSYETKQIKQAFHELFRSENKPAEEIKDEELRRLHALRTPDGKLDREAIAAATERTRAPLAEDIRAAFVPVTHTIRIEPEG